MQFFATKKHRFVTNTNCASSLPKSLQTLAHNNNGLVSGTNKSSQFIPMNEDSLSDLLSRNNILTITENYITTFGRCKEVRALDLVVVGAMRRVQAVLLGSNGALHPVQRLPNLTESCTIRQITRVVAVTVLVVENIQL